MRHVSVIGLGFVGLPIAASFGRVGRTIGYDINSGRIRELRNGVEKTGEIDPAELKRADLFFTDRVEDLKQADFHIISVPTPVDDAHSPNLNAPLSVAEALGRIIKKGDIIVASCSVFPGMTEEILIPAFEKHSGMRCGKDFFVGYSPERVNPGDRHHKFSQITKIVAAQDEATLDVIAKTYDSVVQAGTYRAPSIRVAEAAKLVENTQRDVNIALMNELSKMFDRLGMDTQEVLKAAGTKWNFLNFKPGLVGGDCIPVSPHYLAHQSERHGHVAQLILAARSVNDSMGQHVAQGTIRELCKAGHAPRDSVVTILGVTYKADVPDLRMSMAADVVRELRRCGVKVQLHDPISDRDEAEARFGEKLKSWVELEPAAAVIALVAHREFSKLSIDRLLKICTKNPVLVDLNGSYSPEQARSRGMRFWRL